MYLMVKKIKQDSNNAKERYDNMTECVDCNLSKSDKEHCEQLIKSIQMEADFIIEHMYKYYRDIDRLNHYIKED